MTLEQALTALFKKEYTVYQAYKLLTDSFFQGRAANSKVIVTCDGVGHYTVEDVCLPHEKEEVV